MGLPHKQVILNSKTIDVSGALGSESRPTGGRRGRRRATPSRLGYKLCVCLAATASAHRPAERAEQEEGAGHQFNKRGRHSAARGLVFAVRSQLSCAPFSSFCNQQQQPAVEGDFNDAAKLEMISR